MMAGGHCKRQPMQDLPVAVIAEIHILKHHRGLAHNQRGGARNILHLDLGIDQREHAGHIDQPLANGAIDHAEHVERAEQLCEVRLYEDQLADGIDAPAPAPDGIAHGGGHQQVDDQRLGNVERAERIFRCHRRIRISAGGGGIAGLFAGLGAEIFDRLVIEQRIDRAR